MSQKFFKRLVWLPVISAGLGAFEVRAAEMSPATVLKRTAENGQAVQAVILQLDKNAPGIIAHDHLIFIDTSASQVGAHRLHAFAVLESMLKSLPETDRIHLYAVDVQTESLMSSWSGPKSNSVQTALKALKERIPLGATNLETVVQTALKAKSADQNCSISYIGDGLSTADLLQPSELQTLTSQLRTNRMTFNSYGVGPDINLQLLGILAHQTGGVVHYDNRTSEKSNLQDSNQVALEHGESLAAVVQGPVIFPTQVSISAVDLSLPLPLLPIRADRETIHIVQATLPSNAKVIVSAENSKDALEWQLTNQIEQVDSAFLVAVSKRMEKDHGISNPLAGRHLMQLFQQGFDAAVDNALDQGANQLRLGQLNEASNTARQIMDFDPANPLAKSLAVNSERLRVHQVSQNTKTPTKADLENNVPPEPDPDLTRDQQHVISVKTEKLRNQVSSAIEESKLIEPESGLARLKQADNTVSSSSDIAPEDRLQLRKRLGAEINRLKNLSDQKAQERVQLAQKLAQQEAQKRLTEDMLLDEDRLAGLIERVRGLMNEGRHGNDEAFGVAEEVAHAAIDLRPGSGISSAAHFDSVALHNITRSFRLRAQRSRGFLETLHQVELAHVPFPDEPPVRFPKAEVWAALTERRQKWKNIDLRSDSPREQRIQQELKKPTDVAFNDIPLKDALDFLESAHGIEIWIDTKELSDAAISTDAPIQLTLNGVSLRSVLRLMLEPLLLTYVIEDEVLKITTQTAAEQKMSTRVYPVADLVIPIPSAQGGGQGGGQGGQQGGGQGGGGLGGAQGGGGVFSVPAEKVPAKAERPKAEARQKIDNQAIDGLKKKRNL